MGLVQGRLETRLAQAGNRDDVSEAYRQIVASLPVYPFISPKRIILPQKSDIPHLLALIDDDSITVRDNVYQALRSFGSGLELELLPFRLKLDEHQNAQLDTLCQELRHATFAHEWLDWLDMADERVALEKALSQLAFLDYGYTQPSLHVLLDKLAQKYRNWGRQPSIPNLMRFLFEEEKFSPPSTEYYDPINSNLVYVIQEKQGIQISLSAVAILLSSRLGLELYGLNVPRHFMTMAVAEEELQVYDCFNKGRPITSHMIGYLKKNWDISVDNYEMLKAPAFQIVIRVLQNILNARVKQGLEPREGPYKRVFDSLVRELKTRGVIE